MMLICAPKGAFMQRTASDGKAGSLHAWYRTIPDDAVRYRPGPSGAVWCVNAPLG